MGLSAIVQAQTGLLCLSSQLRGPDEGFMKLPTQILSISAAQAAGLAALLAVPLYSDISYCLCLPLSSAGWSLLLGLQ